MKNILLILLTSSLLSAAGVVNIYTSRHYDSDKLVFNAFTKATGIKVNLIQDKIDPLLVRLEQEGADTNADVFMTVGVGDLLRAKDLKLLQPYESKLVDSYIPKYLRDSEHFYTAITYRARIIVINPAKIKSNQVKNYLDLANPIFKKRLVTRSSTSSYNRHLIAFMLTKYGNETTNKWAKGIVNNFARTPRGNDIDQAKAVANGKADLAIINSYYLGKMINSTDPYERAAASKLKVIFPNQNDDGTHINISGIAIGKYAKNKAEAIKLLEFLTSYEGQEILAQTNYEYPANPSVSPAEIVLNWGEFKHSTIDLNEIGKNTQKAQRIADSVGWR